MFSSFIYTSADKTGVNGVCQTAHSDHGLGHFLSFAVMWPSYSVLVCMSDDSQVGVVDVKEAEAL